MQYPQIQFYRGSLVRLANGQLKQVEDLSSDDFLESARLAASAANTPKSVAHHHSVSHHHHPLNRSILSLASASGGAGRSQDEQRNRFNFQPINGASGGPAGQRNHLRGSQNGGSSGTLDENNNSVFNSPEPTSGASYDDSPTRMDIEEDEDDEDIELDVVTDDEPSGRAKLGAAGQSLRNMQQASQLVNSHAAAALARHSLDGAKRLGKLDLNSDRQVAGEPPLTADQLADFYVDSSVVRDFLEVGPIHQEQMSASSKSSSATSSSNQLSSCNSFPSGPSTSGCSKAHSQHNKQAPGSPAAAPMPQITSAAPASTTQTVLIKFFLETSRSIAFIEVPIEHPFFVLHRGWSSWNPQMTYETFGLKCRKLKIGDTCISLIRRRQKGGGNKLPNGGSHNESDQCNILFSSININE